MAQFGGQKNPPWATQFAATAVSQPGHSGQSIDLNSLHCKYCKPDALSCLIPHHNVMLCSYYMDFIFCTIFRGITSWKNILCYIIIFHWVYFFFPTPPCSWCFIFPPYSTWCAAAVSSGSFSFSLLSAVSLGCSLSQQPVCCKLSAVSANCCLAAASSSSCGCSATAGQSLQGSTKHTQQSCDSLI